MGGGTMAPTPTPPTPPSDEPIPSLHLQILDLSHPGCSRFFSHTSDPHSLLFKSSKIVLTSLYPASLHSHISKEKVEKQLSPSIRSVTLHLRSFDGVAHTKGSDLDNEHKEVHLSTKYVAGIGGESKRIKQEIEGVVVHELVHVYQYDGKGSAPGGLIEGVADWVRMGAGLGPPHWKRGGERWDQGYDATAYFLQYVSKELKDDDFVPKLNWALKDHKWEDGALFKKVAGGESVEGWWKKYKDMLEKEHASESESAPPAIPTHSKPGGGGGYNVQYTL